MTQQWPPMNPPPQTKHHMPWWAKAGIICFGLFVFLVGCVAMMDSGTENSSGITSTSDPSSSSSPNNFKKKGLGTSFSDGTYLVGEDIKAGSYKTLNESGDCYWERDRDDSGQFNSIIANDNLSGPGRVTLHKGEIFSTNGCEWKLVK